MDLQPFGSVRKKLEAVRKTCSDDADATEITGMLQGWLKYDVKVLSRVDRQFQDEIFKPRAPTSQQLEYVRLLITLFVNGNARELFGAVAQLQEPDEVVAQYRTSNGLEPHKLLVGIDRGAASWNAGEREDLPVAQTPCQRLKGDTQFRCKLAAKDTDSESLTAARVSAFLRSACIFPAMLAGQIQARGGKYSRSLGKDIEENVRIAGLPTEFEQFNATVLDERLRELNGHLENCLRLHGSPEVTFPQFGARNI